MKKFLKEGVIFLVLFSTTALYSVSPYISIRSQSVDSARGLAGWTDKVNLYDMENMYITGAITLEGTRSFNTNSIMHNLFGTFNCNSAPSGSGDFKPSVTVSGSAIPNRGATDWFGDYFGLPTTFQSKLYFEPRISNFILDLNFYVGLDEWYDGLYFRVHAPIVNSQWDLNFTEQLINSGLTPLGYNAGYMSPVAVPVANLLPNATAFFSDQKAPTLGGTGSITTSFEALQYGRFERVKQHATSLAEIQMVLGWNFWQAENYHGGVNFRVYAPTGNRPNADFLFQPIVGNGKHWEVGAGLTTHYTFWQREDEESSFGFYLDANFTHLCSSNQKRTFDLKGKPLSRYMLAERMGTNVQNLFATANPTGIAPSSQFQNALVPVANISTLKIKSSNGVQTDITALFNYYYCGLSIDVGYNFWAVSCEKIVTRKDAVSRFQTDSWALKGDAQVYGFASATNPPVNQNDPIPLSATESGATINGGTNNGNVINAGVDNATLAQVTSNNGGPVILNQVTTGLNPQQINTSFEPVLFTAQDLDYDGARTSGLSNKVFAHISYTWAECDDILPYLGIGGKAEFGPRGPERPCNSSNPGTPVITECSAAGTSSACGNCHRTNISEWGVWIKGGIFFY